MATSTSKRGTGTPVGFVIDADAIVLLRTMIPTNRGLGALVSELIRREARERAQRPALLERLSSQESWNHDGSCVD